ncbi:MAG TPA: hypothetical protein VM901_06420 [Bdellovibrionota bacterium]|nr:hypothetical protein [Bdellovibrionota bacterium]
MKKLMGSLVLAATVWGANARAAATADINAAVLAKTVAQVQAGAISAMNMINWKIGDFHKFNVKFLFGGGTGSKTVPSEDLAQNAVWLKNEMTLMGQKQTTETLLSRTDGKVLKLIVNGKEEDPNMGGGDVEILEQYEDNVKVPAGEFKSMFVKLKTSQQGQEVTISVWINPTAVGLDGQLKMVAETQFGPLTLELTEFKIN